LIQINALRNNEGLAALRDFDLAYRRFGSNHDLALWASMSAPTSYGHAAARAYVEEVP
jgi:hypothetical protein